MSAREVPSYARLEAGVTGDHVAQAIAKSGYPFQAEVADQVRTRLTALDPHVDVQEEWAYIDQDTHQPRSIDILVNARIQPKRGNTLDDSRLGIFLNLITECKQSELPYVFFIRNELPGTELVFPEFVGLPHNAIRLIYGEDPTDRAPFSMTLHDVFDLSSLPFFRPEIPYAISLTKAFRKTGQKIELTGEDAYKAITLPLMKAADHLKSFSTPKPDQKFFSLRFVICLAVLRAPMIGACLYKGEQRLIAAPWIRVSRLEPDSGDRGAPQIRSHVRYYDVVHESYLADYIGTLTDSMRDASVRMLGHQEEIIAGAAHALSIKPDELLASLQPVPDAHAELLSGGPKYFITRVARHRSIDFDNDQESTTWFPMTGSRADATTEQEGS